MKNLLARMVDAGSCAAAALADAGSSDASTLADALYNALESEEFSARHWERSPLVLHKPELVGPLAALLTADDLPVLSERLEMREVPHQDFPYVAS